MHLLKCVVWCGKISGEPILWRQLHVSLFTCHSWSALTCKSAAALVALGIGSCAGGGWWFCWSWCWLHCWLHPCSMERCLLILKCSTIAALGGLLPGSFCCCFPLTTILTHVNKLWWRCSSFPVEMCIEAGTECTKILFCVTISAWNWRCQRGSGRCISDNWLFVLL